MSRPITNARRLPMMSPILPPVSMNSAITRQYSVITAWIVVTVVSKSSTSVLIDTFIADWSSTITNWAMANATSGSQFVFGVEPGCLASDSLAVTGALPLSAPELPRVARRDTRGHPDDRTYPARPKDRVARHPTPPWLHGPGPKTD